MTNKQQLKEAVQTAEELVQHVALDADSVSTMTLPGVTEMIRAEIMDGMTAAVNICILFNRASEIFDLDRPGWIKWAMESFNYNKRFCYTCLSVGRMLAELQPSLTAKVCSVDIAKLEMVATLKPHFHQTVIEKYDIASMTRDELRDKLASLRTGEDPKKQEPPRKKKPVQLDFFDSLKGLANTAITTEEQAVDIMDRTTPETAWAAACNALTILDTMADHHRLGGISAEARHNVAVAMRDAAGKIEQED